MKAYLQAIVVLAACFTGNANAQKVTVALSDQAVSTISANVSTANTPEEAYRQFAKLATAAVGQAVADALYQVAAQTKAATSATANIAGWDAYLANGLSMRMDWASPGTTTTSNLPVLSAAGRPAGAAAPAGGSISITIGGTF